MKNEKNNHPDPKKGITTEPSEEQQLEEKDKPVTIPPGKDEGKEKEEVESDDFKEMEQDPIDDEEFDEYGSDDDSDFADASKTSVSESTTNTKENEEEPVVEQPESIKGIEGSVDEQITNQEDIIVNKKGQ